MPSYRLAVLGDPVEHSRSPEIHTAMLSLAGLEGSYERIQADGDVLIATIAGLRRGEWQGLNITMPLKAAAADCCDRLSPQAERSRSVNTLLVDNDDLWGHTTDSATFRNLIWSDRFSELGTILLLGAGASAAAALAAIDSERNVYVSARRPSSAEMLTFRLGGDVISWRTAVAGALVINTTPLGMRQEDLPDGVIEAAAGLIDLPYGPEVTPAIHTARRLEKPVVDGHEFLVRQAMASFELWTGVSIDYNQVVSALRNA